MRMNFSSRWHATLFVIGCSVTVQAFMSTIHMSTGPVPGKSLLKSKFIGSGSYAPPTTITNFELEGIVETSDEWITARTGIKNRHILDKSTRISEIAAEAGRRAIQSAGLEGKDIDLIIVASSSPDDLFGDATTIAASVGCSRGAVAFDMTAACSGFLFATVTAGQFLNNGTFKRALVLGADALSRWVDWEDRNTCILFGDGAGAVVMEACSEDESGLLGFSLHSDGSKHECLQLDYSGAERDLGGGKSVTTGSYSHITMNGKEVYKFATREVPIVLTEALNNAGMTVDDVDFLLLHQANIRIMEAVAQRLNISMDKVITNLSEYGNTSAASIPLALDEAVRSNKVKKGDIIACAGFGAGLSWGAAIYKWGA